MDGVLLRLGVWVVRCSIVFIGVRVYLLILVRNLCILLCMGGIFKI